MTSKFIQMGEVLNYAAAADTANNAIVKAGRLLGVAAVNIKAGTTGSVLLQGVFEVPKAADAVFAQGDPVLFDAAAGNFKVGDGGPCAVAFAAAGAGETTCQVLFTGVPGKA